MSDTTTAERTHLLQRLQETKDAANAMQQSWKDETGNGQFVLTTQQMTDFQNTVAEAKTIRDTLAAIDGIKGIEAWLDTPDQAPSAAREAAADHVRQVKSLGTSFLESDAYREMKGSGFRNFGQVFAVEQGLPTIAAAAEAKDVYSALGGNISIPAIGRAQSLGWTDRTLRPGRVRDLFPAERTDAAILYGIRETGYTNRARVVSERRAADGTSAPTGGATDVYGLKPKSEIAITPITYPIATIAHIMYVHRNTLADEPRMRGILDRDMVDGVKMAEDEQLLYGDGVGDNLTGLINTPGVQTYTGLAADKRSAQIRRAMTRSILAYFQPTGVVLHPLDWEDVELETDTNGAYTVAVSVAVGGDKRVWRLNVVDTPAITEGTFLVGAFGTGAKVYDREQVNVQVSTENRDLFERNAVTLRAEERLGLVVDRPESFVVGSLTTPV